MPPQRQQNPDLWPDLALVLFLVGFDVAARLLMHVPNVSPVMSSAPFAGMALRRRSLALAVPFAAMATPASIAMPRMPSAASSGA